ncbi:MULTISPECIES: ABC transporter permease [unclassified Neisseria]|uniref:ABC transporter permease n=1 Tax=unclassified Neisseria TaxID=2623750 RepID=UPI0010725308|nr:MULTISPECIES: ABC transporter permease [unclassified Neisseria]MBF0804383.1 ABC transporter permease [Neisseria sp. 19428wB4_WF04]TFU42863.1 ABC transporter permease [Neisseria sp. WF04]
MSLIAFFGGIEAGLIYALVALGVLISFRILDFPDLTADGSFPLGAVVFAVCVGSGVNPWLACLAGAAAGACAGMVTAWLNVSLKILPLLASILVMVALYSVNLRITGGTPNIPLIGAPSVFEPFVAADFSNQFWVQPLIIAGFVIAAKLLLDWFFNTQTGLAMRATGVNARMAKAQGVAASKMVVLGMAISNGLIALGGTLFAQTTGSADLASGIGTIVIGLAAVIIGENLLSSKRIIFITLAAVVGALVYRLLIAFALGNEFLQSLGVRPTDLNLITAVLVVIALRLPAVKRSLTRKATS